MTTVLPAADPSLPSGAHLAMRDRLRRLRVVYGGTETLRAGGDEFLPQHAREENDKYATRRKYARLRRNMFRQAVDRITGRIFEVPVKINDVTDAGKVIADDADRRGNSFDRLARVIYHEALKLGLFHCLVDYPVVAARNLAEERAAGARPYMIMLAPEQVIRCYEDEDGVVTHLAWTETTTSWNEARGVEEEVKRVQVRTPGVAKVWEQTTTSAGWVQKPQRAVSVPKVMFHTLYAEKEDHMMGRTPLTEVADLTIEHFQIGSEYRNALVHNLFPVLVATGVDQKDVGNIVMGPDTILGSTKDTAKFAMLEHNGIALKAGADDLLSLEQRAEAYAGQLTKPTGDVKATTSAINSAEVSSFAKDMAQSLEDMLQAVLDDMAVWARADTLGNVEVNMDFAVDLPDGDIPALQGMRGTQDISRETLWREMTRRNVLARDFDPEAEQALLDAEMQEGMQREQEAMKFAASLASPQPGDTNPLAGGSGA